MNRAGAYARAHGRARKPPSSANPSSRLGGAILKWPDDKAEDRGLTVWHVAKKDTDWFSPSASTFMINYRVDDLDEMLTQLRGGGVETVKGPESHENGKFAWILDPDGNKIELWQPTGTAAPRHARPAAAGPDDYSDSRLRGGRWTRAWKGGDTRRLS